MNSFSGEINIGDYEREELEAVRDQLQRASDMIELIIKILKYCEDKEIFIFDRPNFHDLRFEDGLMGSESDITKLESKLREVESAILREMSEEELDKMRKALSIRFKTKRGERRMNPEQSKGYNG